MRMIRMTEQKFLSYVLDKRKDEFKKKAHDIFYYNPRDERGAPSSFVFVVIKGREKDAIWCGGSKYNASDGSNPKSKNYHAFSIEEGLKQACNRAWREYQAMSSLYGKNHGRRQTPGQELEQLRKRINAIARSYLQPGIGVSGKGKMRQRLLSAGKEAYASKKA
jgi:hypothetical protein